MPSTLADATSGSGAMLTSEEVREIETIMDDPARRA